MGQSFLDNFNKEKYEPEQVAKTEIEEKEVEEQTDKLETTPSRVKNRYVEHETDVDLEYQQKRKKRKIKMIVASTLSVLLIIGSIIWMNLVTIINGKGKALSEVKAWADKNRITLETKYEYNADSDENTIYEQDVKAGKRIWKGSTLAVKVSKGADPEEHLELPDINAMNLSQIQKWADTNKFDNLKVTKKANEEIAKDQVLEVKFDNDVSSENFKRKDTLRVTVSSGPEVFEKNIEVPDFKTSTKAEVEKWKEDNGTEVTIETASSNEIPKDGIISQSVAAKEKVSKKDPITIVVSIGKVFTVPNFAEYTLETAATKNSDLLVDAEGRYNEDIAYGRLISQSVPVGTQVTEENNKITVYYSLGLPYIDLSNENEGTLPKYFFDLQASGANITYTITYVDRPTNSGDMETAPQKGDIKSANYDKQFVGLNQEIHIEVYR